MKVRKGQTIHNNNGHSYEVLATRTKKNSSRQDLLLKDKKTKQVVIGNRWFANDIRSPRYGTWASGEYYGQCNSSELSSIKKSFKARKK